MVKALAYKQQQNWVQALRYGEIAATKLKLLKDRRLMTVELISAALGCRYDALQSMGRYREALECIKECYTLWAMNHLRNPGSMDAALHLIQSCIHNNEYEDAERYARHAYFMIAEMTDNFIPSDERPMFLANGSYWLAVAILGSAKAGGIPPEEKLKAGEEAIALARKALELHTQLLGTESAQVAGDLGALADALVCVGGVDDDEILRLREQAIAIYRRVQGCTSLNVAITEFDLGNEYIGRARRAQVANDLDRCVAHLQLALPHLREAARIFGIVNRMDMVDKALCGVAEIEERIREIEIVRAAAAAGATRG